jgi:transcriptional regulator with XRE-family HTH domain
MYLKEFREKIGLTQKELSEKIDLAQSAVARLEKANSNPTRMILQKYIDILNANINYLFTGEGPILKTDTSQLNIENINITNDLLLFNSQEELNKKFNDLLVESIVNKFEKSETTFTKLFDIFQKYNPLKIRPILFMYYIFQNIEKDLTSQKYESIDDEKQYLIEMIQNYEVFSNLNVK